DFWIVGLLAVRTLGAGIDPGSQHADLGLARARIILGRHRWLDFAREHTNHETRVGPVRNDDRTFLAALLQFGERRERKFAVQVIVVVAARTVLSKDRGDVLREIRRPLSSSARNTYAQEDSGGLKEWESHDQQLHLFGFTRSRGGRGKKDH